ncbi:MAG TPA: polysaccharide biosynthesis tyrosine autokinase [Actinomycetota bacterium]
MQQPEPESGTVDLREFFRVISRRKGSIALVTVLAIALAVGLIARRPPMYTSQAEVEVRPLTTAQELQPVSFNSFVNMDTEAARVTQEEVAALAAPALGLDPNLPADLTRAVAKVSVSVPTNTTYLDISCEDASPREAQKCAGAFANAYIKDRVDGASALYDATATAEYAKIQSATDRIEQLRKEMATAAPGDRADIQSQIDELNQLIAAAQTRALTLPTPSPNAAVLSSSPDLPSGPSNKDYSATALVAAILGLGIGTGLALLRDRLEEPVTGREHLEIALDAPVLAVVPPDTSWRTGETHVATLNVPESRASEAYKTARTTLLYTARQGSLKAIEVTGPGEGDGKTTATANLAVALAQMGKRVAAISCDLRKPRLHRFFDVGTDVGLTSVLTGTVKLNEALNETEVPGLSILASGPLPPNPAELLGTDDMERVLHELRTEFDFVLLDTAPALLVSDAITIAPFADAVIVVADSAKTPPDALTQLRLRFEGVGGHIIGGILNLHEEVVHHYPFYDLLHRSESGRDGDSVKGVGREEGAVVRFWPRRHPEVPSPSQPRPSDGQGVDRVRQQ